MVGSARLTLGGFLARFALALLVTGATYNPTRYSYYAWVKSAGFEWRPPTVFVGVVLLIGWVVCLRLTLRSMGGVGLLLANAFLAALYWLVASWGWLPSENVAAISWLGLAPGPGCPTGLTAPARQRKPGMLLTQVGSLGRDLNPCLRSAPCVFVGGVTRVLHR